MEEPTTTPRVRRLLRPTSVLSLLVASALGAGLLGRAASSSAQPRLPFAPASSPRPAPDVRANLARTAAVSAPATASSAAPDPAPASASAAASVDPLSYTEVQTEQDFPPGLSPEQRASLGTGKVPIHREGRFRSPLAHPRFGEPTRVKVGLVLSNVFEYEIQHGTYEADFFLSFTGDKELPPLSLNFSNGKETSVTSLVDAPTFKLYRVEGKFISPPDLLRYPFDSQQLRIEIEDQKAGVDQLLLEPDQSRTALDEGFNLSGWATDSISATAHQHRYPSRFDRDDLYISRYVFSLGVTRFGLSAALSVFVPALVIVIIALTGVFVPPEELEVRSNTGAPMLAAAVLFHYSLIQSLPATGYLTGADKLMLAVYLCILFNMISTWLFVLVHERSVARVFSLGRLIVPPLCVATVIASVVL